MDLSQGVATPHEIVNEILALMGNTVLRSIVSDIQSSSWFSIIADEATDISRNEQNVIVYQMDQRIRLSIVYY